MSLRDLQRSLKACDQLKGRVVPSGLSSACCVIQAMERVKCAEASLSSDAPGNNRRDALEELHTGLVDAIVSFVDLANSRNIDLEGTIGGRGPRVLEARGLPS